MFNDFDFNVLDDPDYKEDAVREDLVAPLLKALGFKPSGTRRVQRSQALLHPFVMIGSKKHPVNIVPDYTLWVDDQAVLVLDAKNPGEELVKSKHVEQAFSYAIHPDVRAKSYALCNGRQFVLYDVEGLGPVFSFELAQAEEQWVDILKHLSPEALANHHHRSFQPDLGIFLENAGCDASQALTFASIRVMALQQTSNGDFSAVACLINSNGTVYQGSFDMPMSALPRFLSVLPPIVSELTRGALKPLNSFVWVGGAMDLSLTCRLGKQITGLYEHDPFIPLVVESVHDVLLKEPIQVQQDGLPSSVLNVAALLSHCTSEHGG